LLIKFSNIFPKNQFSAYQTSFQLTASLRSHLSHAHRHELTLDPVSFDLVLSIGLFLSVDFIEQSVDVRSGVFSSLGDVQSDVLGWEEIEPRNDDIDVFLADVVGSCQGISYSDQIWAGFKKVLKVCWLKQYFGVSLYSGEITRKGTENSLAI